MPPPSTKELDKPPSDNAKYLWTIIVICQKDKRYWHEHTHTCYTTAGLEYFRCVPISKLEVAIEKMKING